MTRFEKYSWASLVTSGLIWLWFKWAMLDGAQIVERSAGSLMGVVIWTFVLFIVAEIAIAILFSILSRGKWQHGNYVEDERDRLVQSRSSAIANWVVVAMVCMLIFFIILSPLESSLLGLPVDLMTKPALIFVLVSVMILSAIVERIATIVSYRFLSA